MPWRAYYGRFGFAAASTGELWMLGRFQRARLLALELRSGALAGARGLIAATGQFEPKPDLNRLFAGTWRRRAKRSRAACRLTSKIDRSYGVVSMKNASLLARFDGPIVMIGFGSIGKAPSHCSSGT